MTNSPRHHGRPSQEDLEAFYRQEDERQVSDPALEKKINKLLQYLEESGIPYDKFEPIRMSYTDRKAYPNFDQFVPIPSQHDTSKWLDAVRKIYQYEQDGVNRVQSIRQVTAGWNLMEIYDFLNWLRFHEQGTHLKYKTAQLWYENGAPGYFLHVKPDPPKEPEPQVTGPDIDFARDEAAADSEKKQIIEKQRNKIIGRLDSAEKLLRSPDGQLFAGKELEALMEAIYQLKKKIQLVNKQSLATKLYEDMIVRQANVLHRDGFTKASQVLLSLAQANNPPPSGTGKPGEINVLPPQASPGDPAGPGVGGIPGGLPSMGPGMPQQAPSESVPNSGPNENAPTNLQGVAPPSATTSSGPASPMPQDSPKSPGIVQFLQNMNTGKITTDKSDESANEDDLEVNDLIEVANEEGDLLVVEGQVAPVDVPMTDAPAPAAPDPAPPAAAAPPAPEGPATEEPLEVTEDDIAEPPKGEDAPLPAATEFDSKMDAVFQDLKVDDVVAKLEDLAKIFKVREVPRQLAIVDMMLDSLGLSTMFPSLSEAQNKALESNNYISTRVDDILSKLRGAMSTKDIDLKGGGPERPEVAGIKNKLQQDADKEKQRKQQRKEMEAAELAGAGKETPEVEINEDLAPPKPAARVAPAPRPVG